MGIVMAASSPRATTLPRQTTRRTMPGTNISISRGNMFVQPHRLHRVTRPISRPPSSKPTHMAKAIVRLRLQQRESFHRRRWRGWRKFCRATSAPRPPLLSASSHLSVRVSFIVFVDIQLICARPQTIVLKISFQFD
jgi:hypothetical protein